METFKFTLSCEFGVREVSIFLKLIKCWSALLYYLKEDPTYILSRKTSNVAFILQIQSSYYFTKIYITANVPTVKHSVLLLVSAHLAGQFPVPKSFIPNSPALRHPRHASQSSLYNFLLSYRHPRISILHAVTQAFTSYTAIYSLKPIYRHYL